MPVHHENFDKKKVHLVSAISFFMAFGQSLIVYVLSSYFKEITGTENVGPFYIVSYVAVLAILLNWHKAIRKIGKAPVFILSVLLKVLVVAMLVLLPPSFLTLIPLILYLIVGALEWTSLDIILESYSQDKLSGRIRGLHLTVFNAGFIFGPLASTFLIEKYGFHGVFLVLLILNSLVLSVALAGLSRVNHRYSRDLRALEILRKVKKRKNILRIYYVSLALEIFFAILVIYTPLYLQDLGYSWKEIGWMFSFMLIPFVLLQLPIGYLADKKLGEKEMIVASLILMAFSVVLLIMFKKHSVAGWAAVLFLTRIGAAALEILRDSYFYKRIDGYDVDMIDFFRTTLPVGQMAGNFIAFLIMLVFPVKIVFLAVVAVVLSALYPASQLQDNKAECEA